MSRGATLSILGLYQIDPHILQPMQLPDGISMTILEPELLSQCAEFEILYPEPDTFKTILQAWSSHRKPVWQRMVDASKLKYNPIENYDRMEEWTDTGSGNSSGEAKNYVAGYNPNNLGNPPGMVEQERSNSTANNSGTAKHSGRTHGNIGVTTSQQMLEQELAVADKLDIYNYIIRDFKNRFCIPLY